MEDVELLIVPDVHGRDFWKEPVKQYLNEKGDNAKIVFLGDYLDPYAEDFNFEDNFKEIAFNMFKEIVDLKAAYQKQITLLLGNHDCGYRFYPEICEVRMDRVRYNEIRKLFLDNKEFFDLAYDTHINGKHFILSHAGISKVYAEHAFKDGITDDNVVGLFNNAYHTEDIDVISTLGIYDKYRGNYFSNFASLVWTDVRTWIDNEDTDYGYGDYNIFGHTQLTKGYLGFIKDKYADIDCQEVFYINKLGELKVFSELNSEKKE
jgi:hypothetical protein